MNVMIAIVALSVGVIGTANYRYYAALSARKAAMRMTATRIGQLFCESWRGVKGTETYDPTIYLGSDLVITASSGPDKPEDFALLGSYTVELNEVNYYVTLSWKDIYTGLRALNVVVAWTWGVSQEDYTNDDDTYESFKLTTYTQN